MLLHIHKLFLLLPLCLNVKGGRNSFPGHKNVNTHYITAETQQVAQQVSGGYYLAPAPVPNQGSPNAPRPAIIYPAENTDATSLGISGTTGGGSHPHHFAQIQKIDVSCGKERMSVRVVFDQVFNGIIFSKGHYKNPNCRFVNANSGQTTYQFDMLVGSCGVAFIDDGLTRGGEAFLEGLLEVIFEEGVQEAWDTARKIRCLWAGNIDQTVKAPISVNMLDFPLLKFSGDTASASLEIQTGRGPGAPAARGLIRIGDTLTAVVKVTGDPGFDVVVRNCAATDGTLGNRIVLSDNRGCATKPKLMGGWLKRNNPGNLLVFAYLSAFKFPDVMDLFLECTVSLCKGTCPQCPPEEFHDLHVPNHGNTGNDGINQRFKRSVPLLNSTQENEWDEESLQLRRVVHVIGPDDLPDSMSFASRSRNSDTAPDTPCFSLLTLVGAVIIALLIVLTTVTLVNTFGRFGPARDSKWR